MPVSTLREYRSVHALEGLQPGDILLKKVFPETAHGAVEKGITKGQKLFERPETVRVSTGFFSRDEKHAFAMKGSHTSEHAAIMLDHDTIAEAVGNGVITASIRNRLSERYLVYRCRRDDVRKAAIAVARGLSTPHENALTGTRREGTRGGSYSIVGALASNLHGNAGFQSRRVDNAVRLVGGMLGGATPSTVPTNDYLQAILDFVHGVSSVRPDMFCSEFAMACYEAGSLGARGKTAFGTDPRAMSPMRMEDVLNRHVDMVELVGRFDSESNPLVSGVQTALRAYERGLGIFRRPSEQSTRAVAVLRELLVVGDAAYLDAAVRTFMGAPAVPGSAVVYELSPRDRLRPGSTLHRHLADNLGHWLAA